MKKKHPFLLILLGVSLLFGCDASPELESPPTATISAVTPTVSAPSATPSPVPSFTPTPLPLNGQQTRYIIDVTVDYYNRFIIANSRSIYTNKTDVPIQEMLFTIYPAFFGNSLYIRSVSLADGTPLTDYRWEGHRMVIPLVTPLLPGDQIEIIHDFELYPPIRTGIFAKSERQLNLSHWFPIIPPYDAVDGWMAYDISLVNSDFVGEHMMFESADFDVTLHFTDRRENMKIAAGVLPVETDAGIHYQMNLSRTFTLSISDVYVIESRESDGIQVMVYAFPEEIESARASAEMAIQAIQLFSELYGPPERDLLSIVEVEFNHNMEFDGLIMLSSGIFMFYNGPETNLPILVPHETAHQWFFSLVGNNQAMEPWLDEALATYSEALYYERYHPELVSWWWANRVDGHGPTGKIDKTIYLEDGYVAYRNSVYLNGAHFMQDLRDAIGDDAFFAFLKAYVQRYRYDIATTPDFFSLLGEFSNVDLALLIATYFANPVD